MKNKKSISLLQFLLTNNTWRFWKKDWSDSIIVEWDPQAVDMAKIRRDIEKLVGRKFGYERSLSYTVVNYKATSDGLIKKEEEWIAAK